MGDYFCIFSKPVGTRDSNEAEFLAIVNALEFSIEKSWITGSTLIIESDSLNALKWAQSESNCVLNGTD